MGAIFGYSWFDLLQIILILSLTLLKNATIATKQIIHSEVAGYPSGFT